MNDLVAITEKPLDPAALVAHVIDPAAGGIALFLGTTRAEVQTTGTALAALGYEAYGEMAVAQMNELVISARQRWPITRVALVHRIGRVSLAEASVGIAVSTPHRAEAFEACRWLIDTLKEKVPIWKREIWADGSGSWVKGS